MRTTAIYSKHNVKCKGSRDGACKHIAATRYALDDSLNICGEDSVKRWPMCLG